MNTSHIQIHGHRGCRGLLPENTIPSFLYALEMGVDAIELDVVLTADNNVLVSHEPWLSHEYCLDPNGNEITANNEKSFNIYKMTYEEIAKIDCGSKKHERFPQQKNLPAHKPLLSEVLQQFYKNSNTLLFNIEIKSDPELYNIFQPQPAKLVNAVMEVVNRFGVQHNCLLQSFDYNVLKELNRNYPEMKCSLLVEGKADPETDLNKLGFKPFGYNPFYKLLSSDIITFCKKNNLQVLVWTVNKINEMKEMANLGVDGIITDYPDRAISLFR
jgi:glycerophosphoryl diester phosphodiesterase